MLAFYSHGFSGGKMSTTLTYGRKLPTDGDRGSTFFDDLEANIAINDAHTHDGVTSPSIPGKNIAKSTQTILTGSWASVAGQIGTYSQTVTLPSGVTTANMLPKFQVNNAGPDQGDIIYPTIRWASTTSYDIFINDNTVEILATYG